MNLPSLVAAMLDLVLPGAGQVAWGRSRSGWNTLVAYLGLLSLLAFSVAWMGLDPRRALVTLGIAWWTFQGLLWLEARGQEAGPPSIRRGLVACLVGLVAVGLSGAGISLRATVAPIRDHGLWPALLPGEWVLVYRATPEEARDLEGRLVLASTGSGRVIGRIVAFGPATVRWSGPGLFVNGKAVPLADLGDVVVSDPFENPEEGQGLRAWMETLADRRHHVFHSRLVMTPEREFRLPENTFLLLADNRSTLNAVDGRVLGPMPIGAVLGAVGPVVWSPGPWGLPRWGRLGMQWP